MVEVAQSLRDKDHGDLHVLWLGLQEVVNRGKWTEETVGEAIVTMVEKRWHLYPPL